MLAKYLSPICKCNPILLSLERSSSLLSSPPTLYNQTASRVSLCAPTNILNRALGGSFSTAAKKTMACNQQQHHTTVSYVTTPNEEVARQLSEKLVANRLAACVNIVKGIESVYEWKDQVEHDSETLLIIKSHSIKTRELTEFVEKNHPYDCPEVVTLKVETGSKAYLDWVHQTINKSPIAGTQTEDADSARDDA